MAEETLLTHRNASAHAAIIFIHGYRGHPEGTWGRFPEFLSNDNRIKDWDIFSFGYPTGLSLDLPGIWRKDPGIEMLAHLLVTKASLAPLNQYNSLAIIAHSMGGLVVQRALVIGDGFGDRVGHVFLFGGPSLGLSKILFTRFWKDQFKDMADSSEFIQTLRKDWHEKFGDKPPFKFWAVAGDQDEFVGVSSSQKAFRGMGEASCPVVPGDHLQIVKPPSPDHDSVKLVLAGLADQAFETGPSNAARVAVETRDFHRAIMQFYGHHGDLDEEALVQLALALDSVGRRDDAMKILWERPLPKENSMQMPLLHRDQDWIGVLAGCHKRRWLIERHKQDAEKAFELYSKGFALARDSNDFQQILYYGTNLSLMELLYKCDSDAAAQTSKALLSLSQPAENQTWWRFAAEAQANLLLRNPAIALVKYKSAVQSLSQPRQLRMMYEHARRINEHFDDEETQNQLDDIFNGKY